MRILVIGYADSIYIKSFIDNTIIAYGDEASILSPVNRIYAKYYDENGIKVYKEKISKGRVAAVFSGLLNRKAFIEKYDVICFHFITVQSLMMVPVARRYGKKVIFTYWGSDLFRDPVRKSLVRMLLKPVNRIVVTSQNLKDEFQRLYGDYYDRRIRVIDFGSNIIHTISQMSGKEKLVREKYGIQKDTVVVSVGYNANPAQKHDEVLKRIKMLSDYLRKRIHLILRITYGESEEGYIDSIKKLLEDTECQYTVFDSYLSDEEIAEITMMTDIFIHAQISDAQSASVCEHLYAGCLVLNPSWLRYSRLENRAFYISYDNYDEMAELLSENIETKRNSKYGKELRNNEKIIYKICSWDTYVPKWRKIFGA